MASLPKMLGQADLAATTDTSVFTGTAAHNYVVSINMVNRNASARTIRIAIAASGTPGASEYIEYEYSLAANAVIERTGICLSGTQRVVCRASGVDVSAAVYGMDQG